MKLEQTCLPDLSAGVPQKHEFTTEGRIKSCLHTTNWVYCTDGNGFEAYFDTHQKATNCPKGRSNGRPAGYQLVISAVLPAYKQSEYRFIQKNGIRLVMDGQFETAMLEDKAYVTLVPPNFGDHKFLLLVVGHTNPTDLDVRKRIFGSQLVKAGLSTLK